MTTEPPAAELQAICERCVQVIADGEGALWVNPPAPDTRRTQANRVPWHVTHTGCDAPRVGYRIEIERVRTWAGLLHWAAHLMDKDWVSDTNFADLIRDTLNPTSTAPGGIRPLNLRDLGHRHVGD